VRPLPRYVLSLPERVIRSLSAISGGLLREIGEVALPASVRRTTLYKTMVDVALRFMIAELGQVEGIYPSEGQLASEFLIKRTASHGIELLGILAFHASPVWVLAALADAAGGGRALVHEIAEALKHEGLLDPTANFETVEQVLDGLERSGSHAAVTLNLPPINIAELRKEWATFQVEVRKIPPKRLPAIERVRQVWEELRSSAVEQGRSVFVVSSLMAVSTVAHVPANLLWLSRAARSATRTTGKVLGEVVLDHYVDTLREIRQTGFLGYWTREFRPYLSAAASQFAPAHESFTGRVLDRF